MATSMGLSARRPVDLSHYPRRSYLNRACVYESAESQACPGVDEDVEHALFRFPRFKEERERYRAAWVRPLSPEAMERCLFASQGGWDTLTSLAATIIERPEENKREEEPATDGAAKTATALRDVMPNGSHGENYRRKKALLQSNSTEVLANITRNGGGSHNIFVCVNAFFFLTSSS